MVAPGMRGLVGALAHAFFLGSMAGSVPADPISYRLVPRDGRLAIQSSAGETIPWTCYSLGPDRSTEAWSRKQIGFIQAGVRLFQLPLMPEKGGEYWSQPFYSEEGHPVTNPAMPVNWEFQVPWLLSQAPDARVILRFGIHPSPAWAKAHSNQYQSLTAKGRPGTPGLSILPSLASDLWLQAVERQVRDTVVWAERQPWRDRIVGYTIFPYCEGATEVGVFGETFDASPVMQAAFGAYAREKYGTDAALRAAWADPGITLDTVRVPTRDEWVARKKEKRHLHWPEPALVQRERDYFLLQQRLFLRFWDRVLTALDQATAARPVLKGGDILKQHMQGWMHNANFDADWFPGCMDAYGAILFTSGSFGVQRLLDHPGLDMLQTPGMYFNRAQGYAWEAEGLSDSLQLRGKVNFMEADMRTWVHRDLRGQAHPAGTPIPDAGTFMTPAEMNAGFDRTLAWALTRNQMFYYTSVYGGNWWYDDPVIVDAIARQHRIIQASASRAWAPNRDAICVVIDDSSPLDEDFSSGFQHLAVYRQIEEGLALCGVPYRIHLLEDLSRGDFPDYRCYLFPNLFRVTAETEAVLRRRVFRDGHVAIFGPGTGLTDGKRLTAEPASRLLGVAMELIPKSVARRTLLQDHGHPISDRLPQAIFADSYAYGPMLVPTVQRFTNESPRVAELGATFYHYFFDRPGLFVVDHGRGGAGERSAAGARGNGDYSTVFSATVPLPPELLRECARYAGCHVWSEAGAVVYAESGLVAVHTVRSGEHVLHLPQKAGIVDLNTGKRLAQSTERLTFTAEAPQTFLFSLFSPGP